jgi:hypothetical protein
MEDLLAPGAGPGVFARTERHAGQFSAVETAITEVGGGHSSNVSTHAGFLRVGAIRVGVLRSVGRGGVDRYGFGAARCARADGDAVLRRTVDARGAAQRCDDHAPRGVRRAVPGEREVDAHVGAARAVPGERVDEQDRFAERASVTMNDARGCPEPSAASARSTRTWVRTEPSPANGSTSGTGSSSARASG